MVGSCIYFKGDRPCKIYWSKKLYKNNNFKCSTKCLFYKKITKRILLIKLDAMGDVVRTTPLVEAIKKKYPGSQLTWLVGNSGYPFLKNNPFIDRILIYDQGSTDSLKCEFFDILINLDKDKKAISLANKINASNKRGFLLSSFGVPFPVNKGSRLLYRIALDNFGEKTTNRKNFQEMIFSAAEIPYNNEEYFFKLDKEDLEFAEKFKKKLLRDKPIIGINSGCGPVYPHKKYPKKGLIEIIKRLNKEGKQVILFGGPDEEKLNKEISNKVKVIEAGSHNSITQFASLLNLCDVIFTGDTLALHLGIALKKSVVCVFGPTPSQEINLYKGKKLVGKVPCTNCYNQFPCIMEEKGKPTCMQTITVEEVLEAINEFV
jgi:heptosyltransferase-2